MSPFKSNATQVLFYVVVLALVGTVLAEVYWQMKKYLEGKTTVSKTSYVADHLDMPAMSFCPGFKREALKKYPWLYWEHVLYKPFPGNLSFPQDRAEAQALWDSVTYGLDEILVSGSVLGNSYQVWYDANDIVKNNATRCLNIHEHDTLSGRCFTFHSTCRMSALGGFAILVNMTQMPRRELDLIFHLPEAYVGLNDNLFNSPVTIGQLKGSSTSSVLLTKHVKKHTKGVSKKNFFDCATAKLTEDIKKAVDNGSFCFFPSFDSIIRHTRIGHANLPVCANNVNYTKSINEHILGPITNWYLSPNCEKQKEQETYVTSSRFSSNNVEEGMSMLYVLYQSLEVIVEEEYVLLDFQALLGAVGGFVGMILGWSLYDLADIIFSAKTKTQGNLVGGHN